MDLPYSRPLLHGNTRSCPCGIPYHGGGGAPSSAMAMGLTGRARLNSARLKPASCTRTMPTYLHPIPRPFGLTFPSLKWRGAQDLEELIARPPLRDCRRLHWGNQSKCVRSFVPRGVLPEEYYPIVERSVRITAASSSR